MDFFYLKRTFLIILLFCFSVLAIAQQNVQITGVVVEAGSEETLPGVTIHVRESRVGTTSDMQGRFTISAAAGNTIIFSFVGFKPYEYRVPASSDVIRVVLESDAQELEALVVQAGIMTRDRFGFTGSYTSVGATELQAVGNPNVLQSLRSLDPSFVMVENNLLGSDPNTMANIELRGQSTMNINSLRDEAAISTNLPLFILDGFETTLQVVNDLDINRIESITLLKDAGSTAIYGSKGANGVVVIETVKPKAGQMFIRYNGNYTIAVPDLSVYNMMNAAEKLEFERLAGRYNISGFGVDTPGFGTGISANPNNISRQQSYYEKLGFVQSGIDSYWLNEPVRVALTQNHSLQLSGGGAMQYIATLSYRNNMGVMKGSERNTYGGNLKLVYRGIDGFNFSNDVSVMITNGKRGSWGSFSAFANANPYYMKRNPDGTIPKYLDSERVGAGSVRSVNPLYNAMLNTRNDDDIFIVTNNTAVEWRLNPELMFRGSLSLTRDGTNNIDFIDPSHSRYDGRPYDEKGSYTSRYMVTNRQNANLMANYSKSFGQNNFTLIARTQMQNSVTVSESMVAVGFPEGTVGYPSQAFSYQPDSRPGYSESVRRSVGFVTAFNYNYNFRYLLDMNYNTEGASSFGRNRRFQSFWSIGLGWNIDREPFAQHWTWLRELKLRATYGMNGNDNINVITQSVYSFNTGSNIFGQPVTLSQVGNPNLRWQVVEKKGAGFDLVILSGNFRLTFDVYENYTDPLIVQLNQRPSTGVSSFPMNMGYMTTRGYEFRANYNIINRPADNFLLSLNLTGSHNRSVYGGFLDALNDLSDEYKMGDSPDQSLLSLERYIDGNSPSDLWAVRSLGIDPATGREIFLTKSGEQTYIYDPDDRVVIANSRPMIQGNIGFSLRYKRLTSNFSFRYHIGAHQYNNALFNKVENISMSNVVYNQDRRALYDRWREPGDVSQFKGISITGGATPVSSRFIQKDSYFRGESINIRYSFAGDEWLNRLKLRDFTVGVSMSDIFTLSTIQIERGIDYPFQRSVQMNVSLNF